MSGHCNGSRATVPAKNALEPVSPLRWARFAWSALIWTLAGNTPTSSAALARPATLRVRGWSRPRAQTISATPLT